MHCSETPRSWVFEFSFEFRRGTFVVGLESFVLHECETFCNHAMEAEEPHDAMKRVLTDVDLLSLIFSALGGADEMLAAAKVAKSWAMVSRDERVWLAFYLKRWGAHMMAEPPLLDLREGDTGVFCGLRNRPDLNGKLIKLGLWLENEGRWVVNRHRVHEHDQGSPAEPDRHVANALPEALGGRERQGRVWYSGGPSQVHGLV